MHSDNIATNVLIDILGMDRINRKSKKLELKDARLNRKMMKWNKTGGSLDRPVMTTCLDALDPHSVEGNGERELK